MYAMHMCYCVINCGSRKEKRKKVSRNFVSFSVSFHQTFDQGKVNCKKKASKACTNKARLCWKWDFERLSPPEDSNPILVFWTNSNVTFCHMYKLPTIFGEIIYFCDDVNVENKSSQMVLLISRDCLLLNRIRTCMEVKETKTITE